MAPLPLGQADAQRLTTCTICTTKKPQKDFIPSNEVPCRCSITKWTATCRECTVKFFINRLIMKPESPLICMHCWYEWPFSMARNILPPKLVAIYDEIEAYRYLEVQPGFLLCPYPDCKDGEIHDTSCPDFPLVRCHSCSRPSCQTCRTPWQEDHSCATFSSSNESSRRTLRTLVTAGARRCPRCHYVIMRTGGCGRIHCNICRTSFWWAHGKLIDEHSDPDTPMPKVPTLTEKLQSGLRTLLCSLRRGVKRVVSKPVRMALQRHLE